MVIWILYEWLIASYPDLDVFRSDYVRRVAIVLLIFLGALPLLRLQGAYFAIATWLIAESVSSVFNEWKVVGAGGGMQIKSDVTLTQLYFAALILLVIMTATIWRLLRSRYGVALTAVRDDEEAAQTVGVDVRQVKMVVFLISGLFTGLAAGLFFMDTVIITPPSGFALSWSAYIVFIVVAGGMGTLAGPILGAIAYVVIDRLLAAQLGGGLLVLGLASILLMFFLPRGLMGVVADLRRTDADRSGYPSAATRLWRLLVGESRATGPRHEQPGVVGAFLLPGSPLPVLRPDEAPYQPLIQAMETVRDRIRALEPDALLIYSSQWLAVLDQLWQTRQRMSGLQVDENWHELGTLRFDLRTDTNLARACVRACVAQGITSRPVDYDGFPIDIGTIAVNAMVNANGSIPTVIASNNLYHDWERTRKLGSIAAGCAIEQGKRVVVIGIGRLSGTLFRDERPFADDQIASEADDSWNRQIMATLERGALEDLANELPGYVRDAKADMGLKHLAWILGAIGDEFRGAEVLAYGSTYGAGAAVIRSRWGDGYEPPRTSLRSGLSLPTVKERMN
ncbi:MAG: hypothetical protein R3E68_20825 [Burkholderiaceae bacterium]